MSLVDLKPLIPFALWCLAAFLAGSIPFGLVLVKLAGKGDVRRQGSGNIGATNVLRTGGKALGIATLLLDAAKGYVPVLLAAKLGGHGYVALAWIGLAGVLGHMYTPWLRFEGGKGVATALGVCLAYHPWVVLPSLATFLLVVGIFRYVSLGSIVAAIVLIPSALGLFGPRFSGLRYLPEAHARYWMLAWVLLALLVVRKHAPNIQRLLQGRENKLGSKPSPQEKADA